MDEVEDSILDEDGTYNVEEVVGGKTTIEDEDGKTDTTTDDDVGIYWEKVDEMTTEELVTGGKILTFVFER